MLSPAATVYLVYLDYQTALPQTDCRAPFKQ